MGSGEGFGQHTEASMVSTSNKLRRSFKIHSAVTRLDRIEASEERWHTIGEVDGTLLLLVVHTLQGQEPVEVIRIISARRATPRERRRYEEANG